MPSRRPMPVTPCQWVSGQPQPRAPAEAPGPAPEAADQQLPTGPPAARDPPDSLVRAQPPHEGLSQSCIWSNTCGKALAARRAARYWPHHGAAIPKPGRGSAGPMHGSAHARVAVPKQSAAARFVCPTDQARGFQPRARALQVTLTAARGVARGPRPGTCSPRAAAYTGLALAAQDSRYERRPPRQWRTPSAPANLS